MSEHPSPTAASSTTLTIAGDGLDLAVEHFGQRGTPVILLHGGGQTRHAWDGAATALADRGLWAVTYDARGHGHSGWAPTDEYKLENFSRDLVAVAETLPAPPVLVGASLGGYASIYALGRLGLRAQALVLVDITLRVQASGVERIFSFMTEHPDGFASVEEAADAVADYLPHRKRPRSMEGLRKNLRHREDGRYYWHWDPRLLVGLKRHRPSTYLQGDEDIARSITIPTLLVRGRLSDLVTDEGVAHWVGLVPHTQVVDVSDAAHMVAGDRNDRFTQAVLDFIEGLPQPG